MRPARQARRAANHDNPSVGLFVSKTPVALIRPRVFIEAGYFGYAQSECDPVDFQRAGWASLDTTLTSHLILLKQTDGTYTGCEVTNTAPFTVIRTIPDFKTQLSQCAPMTGAAIFLPSQVSAHLSSGGYLWVTALGSAPLASCSCYPGIEVAVYDSNLNLISANHYSVETQGYLALVDLNGDGAFQGPNLFEYGPLVRAVAIADLNGDGIADVVWVEDANPNYSFLEDVNPNRASNLMVLLGTGGASFSPPTPYPVSGVSLRAVGPVTGSSVAIGDVNGDGIPDLVTSGVSFLFGDGGGGFPTRRDYWSETPGAVVLADFNGDGKPDIIIGYGNPSVHFWVRCLPVLFGRGGCGAGAQVTFATGPAQAIGGISGIAAADFNSDGHPDPGCRRLIRTFTAAGNRRWRLSSRLCKGRLCRADRFRPAHCHRGLQQ